MADDQVFAQVDVQRVLDVADEGVLGGEAAAAEGTLLTQWLCLRRLIMTCTYSKVSWAMTGSRANRMAGCQADQLIPLK